MPHNYSDTVLYIQNPLLLWKIHFNFTTVNMEKSEDSRSVNWLNVPVIVSTKDLALLQNLVHLEVPLISGKYLGYVCYCFVKKQ